LNPDCIFSTHVCVLLGVTELPFLI